MKLINGGDKMEKSALKYGEDVEGRLELAGDLAREDVDYLMEMALDEAKERAKEEGKDISERIKEIEAIGYKNAMEYQLKLARENGDANLEFLMEDALSDALGNAEKLGIDITKRVEEIRKSYKKRRKEKK